MSQPLISRSPDLKRLQDEGYEVEIRANHLLVHHMPHVGEDRAVHFGTLVSELTLAGNVTARPRSHVAMFMGQAPCDRDGSRLAGIINRSSRRDLGDGVIIDHTFSSKPVGAGKYADYHEKMTTYASILSGPARAIDPSATAKTFRVIEEKGDASPFRYIDTATARAGIGSLAERLGTDRLAIVGVGGSGSYILDLVAKTPVREIHLFDGDRFLQHNAFRSPGAPRIEALTGGPNKADYFAELYGRMRRGIVAHPYDIDESTVGELERMAFVFLSLDRGDAKRHIVGRLEVWQIPLIDVGMGVSEVDGALEGVLRVTTSTPTHPIGVSGRIPFSDGTIDNDYSQNIQIADLNALNAALAVIKWKKLLGFYRDLECEHFSAYTVDGNHLLNEDRP
jgi:hypothetical protein